MTRIVLAAGLVVAAFAYRGAGTPAPSAPKAAVARVWQGKVPKAKADEYEAYLADGVKKLRAVKGNLGTQTLRRDLKDVTEFVVVSYWPDRAAIKAYAGDDIEKARHLPKDKEYLIDPEDTVRHYDIKADDRDK